MGIPRCCGEQAARDPNHIPPTKERTRPETRTGRASRLDKDAHMGIIAGYSFSIRRLHNALVN